MLFFWNLRSHVYFPLSLTAEIPRKKNWQIIFHCDHFKQFDFWITFVKSLSRRENERIDTIRHGSASSFGSMSRAFLSEDEFRIGLQMVYKLYDFTSHNLLGLT